MYPWLLNVLLGLVSWVYVYFACFLLGDSGLTANYDYWDPSWSLTPTGRSLNKGGVCLGERPVSRQVIVCCLLMGFIL